MHSHDRVRVILEVNASLSDSIWGCPMAEKDLVRPSRDGDQFHYLWAARQCLELLPGGGDLVAVTIEGASKAESQSEEIEAGEELIDVGLYYGAEGRHTARLVRYIQLKHSTRHASEAWTASGLKKTIKGFAARYKKLCEQYSAADIAKRFRFEFTTNRPIDSKVQAALEDLASGAVARHSDQYQLLVDYSGFSHVEAPEFFSLFSAQGLENGLWVQRNLLIENISAYLPDADYDAPIQLKELVTRKATTEFESNPSILRHDVLQVLRTSEELLQPAPCFIPDTAHTVPREQEQEILHALCSAKHPLVIHADGGVGKSTVAARLAAALQPKAQTILYDCFGDGLYRNSLHFRHRHRDALVQIANDLAARGLCHPLIPTSHADAKQYMRAFVHRLAQAAGALRAKTPDALVCLIIDAADNAEMVAEELGEAASFVRDLIRTKLPEGVCIAFTCRTHRRRRLGAPLETQEIELHPFSKNESAHHLRSVYSSASDSDVGEFAFLSSSNPRVQALALSQKLSLPEMLTRLGPTPTTVESAIGGLLDAAVARLRDQAGNAEASQIDAICRGLAVLRPLVPIRLLAQLAGISEAAVRSFALDFGRPLLLKGDSLHFVDEPAETWFREKFQPDARGMSQFLESLRPLTAESSYAAAMLPQLLLQAGKLDELIELALSGDGLPTENPLAKRDVELQRLTFALKACLQQGRHMAAAKLAVKAGGECAGDERQNKFIQTNTDLAAALMAPDRLEELVSRRIFGSGWTGSRHAYDAGLLSGREELHAEATSRLRMAMDWLYSWARRSDDDQEREEVDDADRAELSMCLLRLQSPEAAAGFLRRWTSRRYSFEVGTRLGKRLIDLGHFDQFDALAHAAGNNIWLLLGLCVEARAVGYSVPAAPLIRLLRLLADRRVLIKESMEWGANWAMLYAVASAIELAVRVLPPEPKLWVMILKRYLPEKPPGDMASRYGFDRTPLLRAYALEAALRGEKLTLIDIAPPKVREQLEGAKQHGHSQETQIFLQETAPRLPWFVLSAEVVCGRLNNLSGEILAALKETRAAESRHHRQETSLRQTATLEWLRILCDAKITGGAELEAFESWVGNQKTPLWPETLISLCRIAARFEGFHALAMSLGADAYQELETSREHAESRADSYVKLSRAILALSLAEARVYFDRAVEIASRIGEENLDRWAAQLDLAEAAGERGKPRPQTTYRLSRMAELTYEYVARDKYFDWDRTVEALTDLCASSCMAILSRWRDRRFGDIGRLFPLLIYRLLDHPRLPAFTPVAFAGLEAQWDRLEDLKRALLAEVLPARQRVVTQVAYRYVRIQRSLGQSWSELSELSKSYGFDCPDIDRLVAASLKSNLKDKGRKTQTGSNFAPAIERRRPDWNEIFLDVDLANAAALRSAYALIHTYDPPLEFKKFFQEAFRRVKVGREPELIRAIAGWPDFDILELHDFLDALPSPLPRQISFRKAIRDAVLSACRRDPSRVHRKSRFIPFERFNAEGLVSEMDVVTATLAGYAAQADSLNAGDFFRLVHSLAACLSPVEADEALNFSLDLLEVDLKPNDGDGPWGNQLLPPHCIIASLSGYIWSGLGSPVVAERWQFAHVVRSAVELGWTELLEALLACTQQPGAGAFSDQRLEFYYWHAHQWLLIGLVRGGQDNAAALRIGAPFFRRWLEVDHVLIREIAAQGLRKLVAAGELAAEEAGNYDVINQPSLPEEVYANWWDIVEDQDGGEVEETCADEKYYFGLDISSYWFSSLGRAFGLSGDAIDRRARQALRQHMGWKGAGRLEDARYALKIFSDGETQHSHGSLPKTDDQCAYNGYHAMMLVAASLLKERPVRRNVDETSNDFQKWLSEYLLTRVDGHWLADRRDPRILADPTSADGYGDNQWCWGVTADYLDLQLVRDDGLTVLWGHWGGGDDQYNEAVSVRSALVSKNGAEALLAALQTAPEFDRFVLPTAGVDESQHSTMFSLKGWLEDESLPSRLDEGDPWADGIHYPGPSPSDDMIKNVELIPSSDGRTWSKDGAILRSEIWIRAQGYGREAENVPGWRLSGNLELIQALLKAHPDFCLILSVVIKRRSPRHGEYSTEIGAYPRPYARYYLMGEDGVARTL